MSSFIALQAASEAFLTERLPNNWESLTEINQNDFLTDNAWYPLENYPAEDLYKLIEDHASTIQRLLDNPPTANK